MYDDHPRTWGAFLLDRFLAPLVLIGVVSLITLVVAMAASA